MAAKRKREWFDDETYWRTLFPFMFPETRFAQTPAQMRQLVRLAKPRGREALDLCCGPGRCSVALARLGFRVTGVDKTPFLLNKARRLGRALRRPIEFVRADMRDFVRPGAFDLAISMFTSFGYFDDQTEDLAVLRNIFASLRPGGVFVIDVMGKERLARILQPVTCTVLADGARLIQRHHIFDDWTRVGNEWIVIRGGRAQSFRFHHTVYSGQELRTLLVQAGFTGVRLYGDLAGRPYDAQAQRLIAVARKIGTKGNRRHAEDK